jgi:hypothetical protein
VQAAPTALRTVVGFPPKTTSHHESERVAARCGGRPIGSGGLALEGAEVPAVAELERPTSGELRCVAPADGPGEGQAPGSCVLPLNSVSTCGIMRTQKTSEGWLRQGSRSRFEAGRAPSTGACCRFGSSEHDASSLPKHTRNEALVRLPKTRWFCLPPGSGTAVRPPRHSRSRSHHLLPSVGSRI